MGSFVYFLDCIVVVFYFFFSENEIFTMFSFILCVLRLLRVLHACVLLRSYNFCWFILKKKGFLLYYVSEIELNNVLETLGLFGVFFWYNVFGYSAAVVV